MNTFLPCVTVPLDESAACSASRSSWVLPRSEARESAGGRNDVGRAAPRTIRCSICRGDVECGNAEDERDPSAVLVAVLVTLRGRLKNGRSRAPCWFFLMKGSNRVKIRAARCGLDG